MSNMVIVYDYFQPFTFLRMILKVKTHKTNIFIFIFLFFLSFYILSEIKLQNGSMNVRHEKGCDIMFICFLFS